MKAKLVSGKRDFSAVQYNGKRFTKNVEVTVTEDEKTFLEELKGYTFEFSDLPESESAESQVEVASDVDVELAPADVNAAAETASLGAGTATRSRRAGA